MSNPPRPDLPCEHPSVNEVWVTTCSKCGQELERLPAREIELSQRVLQLERMIRVLRRLEPPDATQGKHAADRPKPRTGVAHGPGDTARQTYETDFGHPRHAQEG